MSKLNGFDDADRKRIIAVASQFVASRIERGEIPCTNEAIKEAMPQAVKDAKEVVAAANEFLCG